MQYSHTIYKSFIVSTLFIIFSLTNYSKTKDTNNTKVIPQKSSSHKNTSYVFIKDKKLSLSDAMKLIIYNNLTLRNAKYDVIQLDTEFEEFKKRYTWNLIFDLGYLHKKVPIASDFLRNIQGDTTRAVDFQAYFEKVFSSATTLRLGISHYWNDTNDQGFTGSPATPALNEPALFFTLEQELVKNAFGIYERKQKKVLKDKYILERNNVVNQLASLLVTILADYWEITILAKEQQNAKIQLRSTRQLRNIIVNNARLGVSHDFAINQYNALVSSAENNLKIITFQLKKAKRKLIRQINVDPSTEITGVTDLLDTLPIFDLDKSLKYAFSNRVDYKNAQKSLEILQEEKKIHFNNTLPSLKLKLDFFARGQNNNPATAYRDAYSFVNPEAKISLVMTYPIGDTSSKVQLRNTYLKERQAQIQLKELKTEITDEVKDAFEELTLRHKVFKNSKKITKDSTAYYNKVLKRAKQGNFDSILAKAALDTMIDARQQELDALVTFNVSLLGYYLSKNQVFEIYDIDIENLLKKIK